MARVIIYGWKLPGKKACHARIFLSGYHKGASIMRNISYLMLHRLVQQDERVLFLSADNDQQFHACTDAGREVLQLFAVS